MIEPFYDDGEVTVICGDARAVLPHLEVDRRRAVVLTDPVWPNCGAIDLAGAGEPWGLWTEIASQLPRVAERLIVLLGDDSDPRFLAGVPRELAFFRATWLRYALVVRRGQHLKSADLAYVFGRWPRPAPERRVFPGEVISHETRARDAWRSEHPCPRRPEHIRGLVRGYCCPDDILIDPCAGSGTIIEAREGRRVIAIDVDERWCREMSERAQAMRGEGPRAMPDGPRDQVGLFEASARTAAAPLRKAAGA